MSDFPSGNWVDNQIKTAAQINTGERRTAKVLQDVLMRLVHGDTVPADGTVYALGGLVCSAVSGTMRTQVSRGAAFLRDSSLYTSPLSEYGLAYLEAADTTTLVHDAADATYSRYDLICIAAATGTTHTETVTRHPDVGGGSLSQALVRESVPTLSIVKGTAAGPPTVPTTPSGKIALASVLIEVGDADAANFTYADMRPGVGALAGGTRGIISSSTDTGVASTPHRRAIVASYLSRASGSDSAVIGGNSNVVSGSVAVAAGGSTNTVSGDFAVAAGGSTNTVSGDRAAAVGGVSIVVSGDNSVTAGGGLNICSGARSVLLAGQNVELADDNSVGVGYSASSITASGSNQNVAILLSGATGQVTAKLLKLTDLPVYADNAAAASLATDTVYQTATGELRIKV